MYTEREVREILDRVYAEAYDAGIDDTLEYFEENYELDSDDSFDLMDEYESYTESKASTKAKNKETFMKNTTPYGGDRKRVDSNYRVHFYNKRGEERSGTKDADDIKDDVRHSYLKKAIVDAKERGDSAGSRMNLLAAPRKSYTKYKALYDKAVANGKKSWADREDIKKTLKEESEEFDLETEYSSLLEMDQKYKDGFKAAADASHATGEKKKNLAKFYAAQDLGDKLLNRRTSVHARTQKELDEKLTKREELRNRAGKVWKKGTDYLRKSM